MLKTESSQSLSGTPGKPAPGVSALQSAGTGDASAVLLALFFRTTDGKLQPLLRQTAITGILAVGMVFVIISAEIPSVR